jgi:hypothetical protein
MALTNAQLLSPPGGAADLGAVKAGSNVTINTGVLNTSVTAVSQITAGTNISVNSGTGSVLLTYTGSGGASGEDNFPAGTQMPFAQAAAPTGWTKNTDVDNAMMRVVSTSGGGTGGSQNFTSVCTTQSASGTANVPISFSSGGTSTTDATPGSSPPAPTINFNSGDFTYGGANNIAHNHIITGSTNGGGSFSTPFPGGGNFSPGTDIATNLQGGNGPHSHSIQLQPIWTNRGGGSHSHSFGQFSTNASASLTDSNQVNLGVKYVDSLICTKN